MSAICCWHDKSLPDQWQPSWERGQAVQHGRCCRVQPSRTRQGCVLTLPSIWPSRSVVASTEAESSPGTSPAQKNSTTRQGLIFRAYAPGNHKSVLEILTKFHHCRDIRVHMSNVKSVKSMLTLIILLFCHLSSTQLHTGWHSRLLVLGIILSARLSRLQSADCNVQMRFFTSY